MSPKYQKTYEDLVVKGYLDELGLGTIVKSVCVSELGEAFMVTLKCTEQLPRELKDRLYDKIRFRLTHRRNLQLNGLTFTAYRKVSKLAVRYITLKGVKANG